MPASVHQLVIAKYSMVSQINLNVLTSVSLSCPRWNIHGYSWTIKILPFDQWTASHRIVSEVTASFPFSVMYSRGSAHLYPVVKETRMKLNNGSHIDLLFWAILSLTLSKRNQFGTRKWMLRVLFAFWLDVLCCVDVTKFFFDTPSLEMIITWTFHRNY